MIKASETLRRILPSPPAPLAALPSFVSFSIPQHAHTLTGYCRGGGMSVRMPGNLSEVMARIRQQPRRPSMPAKRSKPEIWGQRGREAHNVRLARGAGTPAPGKKPPRGVYNRALDAR